MRCGAARYLIQESLDKPLPPPDEAMVSAHVAQCQRCECYRDNLEKTVMGFSGVSREECPVDIASAVNFRLGQDRLSRRWVPFAVAAAVLVGVVVGRPFFERGIGFEGTQTASLTPSLRAFRVQAQPAADGAAAPRYAREVGAPPDQSRDAKADQATAEFLRWMDPAADGGSALEVEQVDFRP